VLPSNLEVSFFPDYYNQGNKYWNIGAYELATAEYEKALSVRPGDHPGVESLYRFLASVYLKGGQLGRAQTLLQKAALRYPSNSEFHEKLQIMRALKQQPTAKPEAITPKDPSQ
jgi:tetratricopeptide (TPR) repeat protein